MVMRRVSPLLLVVALLRGATAAPLAVDSYRELTASDCGKRDVAPQPACGGNRNLSVAVLEACCDSTRGCGGFNTHGVMKDMACAEHVVHQPTTDLYLKGSACNTFTTKPSCPPPRCAWTPAAAGSGGTCGTAPPPPPPPFVAPPAMPWPFPNDAQMRTGASTVPLSHDFAISRAAGPACPTLDTAVKRYQDQAIGLHIARPQEDDGGPVLRQLLVQVGRPLVVANGFASPTCAVPTTT